jgi:hypothetical protein
VSALKTGKLVVASNEEEGVLIFIWPGSGRTGYPVLKRFQVSRQKNWNPMLRPDPPF